MSESGGMTLGPSRASVALLIALAIGDSGCALLMQQPPKENRAPREVPVCSTGRGGVALDGVLAALLGAGALVGLASDEPGVGLGLGAVAAIYTYSAVSGHRSASRCSEAMKDYQMELALGEPRPNPALRMPRPPAEDEPPATAAGPPPRPAGPPIEEAAPPEEETLPPDGAEAAPPAPARQPDDWSDFWVEVRK